MNTHLPPHAFPHAFPLGLLRNGHDHHNGLGHRSGPDPGPGRDRRNGRRFPGCRRNRGESRCQRPDDLLRRRRHRHHESRNLEEGCSERKRSKKGKKERKKWNKMASGKDKKGAEQLTSVEVPAVPVLKAIPVAVSSSVVTVVVPPRAISEPIRLVAVA